MLKITKRFFFGLSMIISTLSYIPQNIYALPARLGVVDSVDCSAICLNPDWDGRCSDGKYRERGINEITIYPDITKCREALVGTSGHSCRYLFALNSDYAYCQGMINLNWPYQGKFFRYVDGKKFI